MAKLLAIDLDGTLFYPKNIKRCIPRKNVKFLRRWIDVGNKLVLVTSRSTQFIEKLKDEIKRPVDFVTCCSSQIIADNKLIYDKAMPNREIKEIVETIEKAYEPIALLMTTDNHPCIIKTSRKVSFIFRWFYKIWWWFQFAYREPFVADDELFVKELETARIFKIMIFIGLKKKKAQIAKELNKEFRQKFPEIESSWTVQVNELTPEGCNKGNGVEGYHYRFKNLSNNYIDNNIFKSNRLDLLSEHKGMKDIIRLNLSPDEFKYRQNLKMYKNYDINIINHKKLYSTNKILNNDTRVYMSNRYGNNNINNNNSVSPSFKIEKGIF